nr:structural maintenance of chromosomes 4 [Cryptomonas curvata]
MQKIWIKSIRIENFKSYNNLLEIGPLNPKINIITGLNGSGKSNLMDGFSFVFGKRASKIRFKKLYELIHASDKKVRVYGSINLTLNISEILFKQNTVNSIEICISRQIFSNNLSIYYFNGKEINFFEINKIFLNFGVNILNDYFLVKQNEIEKISLFKPFLNSTFKIGLLEYIEDIFKTSRYIELMMEKKNKIKSVIFSFIIKLINQKKNLNLKNKLYTEPETKNNSLMTKILTLNKILTRLFSIRIRIFSYIFSLKNKINEIKKKIKTSFKRKKKIFKSNPIEYGYYSKLLNAKVYKIFCSEKKSESKLYILKQNYFLIKYKLKPLITIEKNQFTQRILELIFKKKYLLYLYKKLYEKNHYFKILFKTEIKIFNEIIFFRFSKYKLKKIQIQLKREKRKVNGKMISSKKFFYLTQFVYFLKKCSIKIGFLIIRFLFYEIYHKNGVIKKQRSLRNYKLRLFFGKKKLKNDNIYILYKVEKNWFSLKRYRINSINRKNSKINYSFIDNHFIQLKNLTGIIGILGSFGFIKFRFLIAVLAIACFELKSFIIDTVENASNVANILKLKKIKRTAFIVTEKLGYLENYTKKLVKIENQLLIDKIYFNKAFNLPFFLIFGNTILTRNLTDAISISLNDLNRKKTVTLDGKIIETSGLFSGGGFANNDFFTTNRLKHINWIINSKFYFFYTKFIKKFLEKLDFLKKTMEKRYRSSNLMFLNLSFKQLPYFSIFLSNKIFFGQNEEILEKSEVAIFILFFYYEFCKLKNFFVENLIIIHIIIRRNILFSYSFTKIVSKKSIKQTNKRFEYCKNNKNIEFKNSLVHLKLNLKKIYKALLKSGLAYIKNASISIIKKMFYFLKNCFVFDKKIKKILKIKKIAKFSLRKLKKIFYKNILLEKKFYFNLINDLYEKIISLKFKKKRIKLEIKKAFLILKLCNNFFLRKFLKCYSRNKFKFLKIFWKKLSFGNSLFCIFLKKKHFEFKIYSLNINFINKNIILKVSNIFNSYSEFFFKNSIIFVKNKTNHILFFFKFFTFKTHYIRISEFLNFLFDLDTFLKLIYTLILERSIMEIESIDHTDPFKQGIILSIKPDNENWKALSSLSGGEKSISSLSLLFSLQIIKPSFLYLMDEIDAALDFVNVNKVSRYILLNNRNFQIAIISLRKNMLNKLGFLILFIKLIIKQKFL